MNSFWVILKKELVDIFRDRKTLIFTILLPIIMYPVMFKIIDSTMKNTVDSVKESVTVAYKGSHDSSVYNILKSMKNIKIESPENADERLKKGKISLIIEVPKNFDANVEKQKNTKINIIYDEDSNRSYGASSMVKEIFDKYSKSIVDQRLEAKGMSSKILVPFDINETNLKKKDDGSFASSILGMLPTLLVIFMISPTIGMAADLVAGEKERDTFEALLSTSVSRMSIFWGKLVSISVVAIITLAVTLASMIGSMVYMFSNGGSISIPMGAFLIIGIVSIFVLVSVSSIEISISIFSRSMKEANTYLGGFLVPVMILTYIPFMMDPKNIGIVFFNIPVVNAISVMKEAIAGVFSPLHIMIVILWHIVYVVITILFAKYMFSREEVVFRS